MTNETPFHLSATPDAKPLTGKKGWLFLFGLGLTISTLRNWMDIINLFFDAHLHALWGSPLPQYHGLAAFVWAGSLAMLAVQGWTLAAYAGNREALKARFNYLNIFSIFYTLFCVIWTYGIVGHWSKDHEGAIGFLFVQLMSWALWGAYLHRSKRVANTMVN